MTGENKTPFEKFRQFIKMIVAVPKAEIDRREQEYKKTRADLKQKRAKQPTERL
jgi:hypothetical protein